MNSEKKIVSAIFVIGNKWQKEKKNYTKRTSWRESIILVKQVSRTLRNCNIPVQLNFIIKQNAVGQKFYEFECENCINKAKTNHTRQLKLSK